MWDAPVGASSPVAPRGGTEGATGAAGVGGGTAATCTCTGKKQLKCWVCPIFGRCKPEEVKEALKVLGAYQEDEDYSTCLLKLLRIERSQVWQGGRGGGGGGGGGQCGAVLEGKGRVKARQHAVSMHTPCAPGGESALGGDGRATEAVTN